MDVNDLKKIHGKRKKTEIEYRNKFKKHSKKLSVTQLESRNFSVSN